MKTSMNEFNKEVDSQSDNVNPPKRTIRSFVRRQGRLTAGQSRAMSELWPSYGIEYNEAHLDFRTVFQNDNDVYLEIGFGNGETLVTMAQNQPDKNFIGIEVHEPGVGACLLGIESAKIHNLRLMCHDAVEVLKHMIPDTSIAKFQIYFPDPWHKKRHKKRRLIQPEFVNVLLSKLKPQGVLHFATDWEEYASQMVDVLNTYSNLTNLAGDAIYMSQTDRPETKFERRGLRLGHGVWDVMYRLS